MIVLQDITKTFNEGADNEYTAIHGVDLKIDADRVTVLRGPSGSGKTTLLTLIGGLARPSSGRIHVNGREVTSLPERFLTHMRREVFGFVFQSFNLIHGLSVLENVMIPAYPLGGPGRELNARAVELLETLRIAHKAGTEVQYLSGGEAQRVAIARALINDPPILVADEPTANLDTALSLEFLDIVRELRGRGKTVVMTSHDPMIWQADLVDAVVAMRDGRIVDSGVDPGGEGTA
ncbi:MAG: ABC transporter ATP-binding protein [Alphaproteobacteria bacterium]|nr:ABC transporter ATP-binding protein [Alphaproteobacteria bacterium]MBF0250055.1 ABC transporter ATP-binding protein [Alphaproteobacteria bacterium]